MPKPRHPSALLATVSAFVALAALPAPAAVAAAPRARAAGDTRCNIHGKEEDLGPTYVTYVGVSGGASCSFAVKLVRSFDECRLKHGGITGTCGGVDGFHCSERRYAKIAVQYDAQVDCARGTQHVRQDYTQFT